MQDEEETGIEQIPDFSEILLRGKKGDDIHLEIGKYFHAFKSIIKLFNLDKGYYTEKVHNGTLNRIAKSEARIGEKRKPSRKEEEPQTIQTGGCLQINYLVRL